ncbi:MAG: renalase [Paraglaciecola sp.]
MKIAIVGAGLTGSLLAHQLFEAGHQVTVFEKSRGRGGRSTQKRLSWGNFDIGASVIVASDPDFIGFMHAQVKAGTASRWPATVHEYDADLSVAQGMSQQHFVFNPGMNGACRQWLAGCTLHTECKIENVSHTKGSWHLFTEHEALSGSYDWLIVTAPWPQTQQLLQAYLPEAPLKNQDWRSCWSLAMQLVSPIDTGVELLYLKNSPVQCLIKDSAKPLRAVSGTPIKQLWVAQLNNEVSEKLTKDGAKLALEMAKSSLSEVFKIPHPELTEYYQHYWRFARTARGVAPMGLVSNADMGLAAGGDWSFGASIQASFQAACALSALIADKAYSC